MYMEGEMYQLLNNMKLRNIIPSVHFFLTFLFERILFKFRNNWDVFLPLTRRGGG